MIVLWIDPWTTTVWYAIVEKKANAKILLDYGVINTKPKLPIKDKILEIWNDLDFFLEKYSIDRVVIEKLFFATNVKTAIDVAQVRWAILYKLACKNIEIFDIGQEVIFDGELYIPNKSLQNITSAVKAYQLDTMNVKYYIFDVAVEDDCCDCCEEDYIECPCCACQGNDC